MAGKKNARNEVNKKRQAGLTKELKKKKKTGYYSHSKGI